MHLQPVRLGVTICGINISLIYHNKRHLIEGAAAHYNLKREWLSGERGSWRCFYSRQWQFDRCQKLVKVNRPRAAVEVSK